MESMDQYKLIDELIASENQLLSNEREWKRLVDALTKQKQRIIVDLSLITAASIPLPTTSNILIVRIIFY
jgi:hypothetical protein